MLASPCIDLQKGHRGFELCNIYLLYSESSLSSQGFFASLANHQSVIFIVLLIVQHSQALAPWFYFGVQKKGLISHY